jgi:hypothetical protein
LWWKKAAFRTLTSKIWSYIDPVVTWMISSLCAWSWLALVNPNGTKLGSCKIFVNFYGLYKNVFHTKGDATILTIMVAHNHSPASIMSIVIQGKI